MVFPFLSAVVRYRLTHCIKPIPKIQSPVLVNQPWAGNNNITAMIYNHRYLRYLDNRFDWFTAYSMLNASKVSCSPWFSIGASILNSSDSINLLHSSVGIFSGKVISLKFINVPLFDVPLF